VHGDIRAFSKRTRNAACHAEIAAASQNHQLLRALGLSDQALVSKTRYRVAYDRAADLHTNQLQSDARLILLLVWAHTFVHV
jgi:hypothetical protein